MAPAKKRTSIYVDEELWKRWMHFVIDHCGSSRKASEAVEHAISEYMERHGADVS